jgi:alkyl hydroperoxide reductase subunit F
LLDCAIIGGGPAGLTATIYAIRKRINVLMVTRDLGGKTNYRLALPWIDEYSVINGLEVINKFKRELEYLDFARHMEPVDIIKKEDDHFIVVTRGGGELKTKSVILASGARQLRLRVPGEKNFMMRGLCYSAISYAPLFIDRTVTIIGDGKLAFRSVAELSKIAKQVYLICQTEDKLIGSSYEPVIKKAENVKVLKGYEVLEVKGDKYARTLIVKDNTGKTSELETDGTFIEMALLPNSRMVEGLAELDDQERVIIDCATNTNVPGLFAAGDVTSGFTEQVLIAMGEGAKAALSAYEYLLPYL